MCLGIISIEIGPSKCKMLNVRSFVSTFAPKITTMRIFGYGNVIVLLLRASLTPTYCFKFEVVLKTWPKVKVCLFSNSCCVISSKIEKKSIVPI